MPRLTTQRYLAAHLFLRYWRLEDRRSFACLSASQQWHVHDFFKPARELTESELREHRKAVSRERPSLPHQAGKALAFFEATVDRHLAEVAALQHRPPRTTKPRDTEIRLQ